VNHSAARINYNRLSRWYDLFSKPEIKFKETCLHLLDIQLGEKVLEIGFGTGHVLIDLAYSTGGNGNVFGIDLSDGMFHMARINISRSELTKNVNLQQGDAVNLPYKNNYFNAIFMSFTLELFSTEEALLVLRECKRVLCETGRIGIVALNQNNRLPVKIYNWFHARMPTIVDCHPINLRNIIDKSGFEPIGIIEKSMNGLPVVMLSARKNG
jgi:demethylmenaquinone methyltransferase/2-methoxy-6-polyprenyl-1,4-benzoquinol methylase